MKKSNIMTDLKIIGAGFGRTGTYSLKLALEKLGFGPCYHMADVMVKQNHVEMWNDAIDGRYDWQKILKGFKSTVDWPSTYFWKVLLELNPDAKVILSLRDEDSWYNSAKSTIYQGMENADKYSGLRGEVYKMASRIVLEKTFLGRFDDEQFAKKVYREHIEDVKKSVRAENLLLMDVKEGWQPLCEFLNVELPAEEFPRTNTKSMYQKRLSE